MTGFDFICESIALFENSLAAADPSKTIRTVAQLAKATGYSVYHFARLFHAVTGSYPKDYMAGRILSLAARDMVETERSLRSIAERFGFLDYETFSRACKRKFGLSPRRIRELRYTPSEMVLRVVPERRAEVAPLVPPEPGLVEMGSFCLCGLPFYIGEGVVSFHRQWAIFMGVQSMVVHRTLPEVFCQFSSWADVEASTGLSVLCSLETAPDALQNAFFSTREVPAAEYIRFVHSSGVSNMHETYRYIYQTWFASREIKPAGSWEFQRYPDGGKTIAIYIPIALH